MQKLWKERDARIRLEKNSALDTIQHVSGNYRRRYGSIYRNIKLADG
jgi:hypothetical protein